MTTTKTAFAGAIVTVGGAATSAAAGPCRLHRPGRPRGPCMVRYGPCACCRPPRRRHCRPGSAGALTNVVNPGPVDTGWMTDTIRASGIQQTPLGRLGTPHDTANLVDFLCSPQGQWINGQLLFSNGGFS